MIVGELVVTVGGNEKSREGGDPTRKEAEDVERGLVRPVHVLDNDDRRCPFAELVDECRGDALGDGSRLNEFAEVLTDRPGDVCERAEWTRCEEWIAGATEDPGITRRPVAEELEERGLPDTSLAVNQDTTPLAGQGLRQRPAQEAECGLSFEERYGRLLGASPGDHADIVVSRSEGFKRS